MRWFSISLTIWLCACNTPLDNHVSFSHNFFIFSAMMSRSSALCLTWYKISSYLGLVDIDQQAVFAADSVQEMHQLKHLLDSGSQKSGLVQEQEATLTLREQRGSCRNIKKGTPNIWVLPQPKATPTFPLGVSFRNCVNIEGEPPNFGEFPSPGPRRSFLLHVTERQRDKWMELPWLIQRSAFYLLLNRTQVQKKHTYRHKIKT